MMTNKEIPTMYLLFVDNISISDSHKVGLVITLKEKKKQSTETE